MSSYPPCILPSLVQRRAHAAQSALPAACTTQVCEESSGSARPLRYLYPKRPILHGRHERVSHRIGVIVDSNDMPVMRSHCVAKEI